MIFNLLFKEIPVKDSILGVFICGGSVWIIVLLIEFVIKKSVWVEEISNYLQC